MSVETKHSRIVFDFTGYDEGLVTRRGYHISKCPECGRMGERRQEREGRRRIAYVHTTQTRRRPDGTVANPEHLDVCKVWETTYPKQPEFPGWVDYRYEKDATDG